jgi:hypothetical protein
MAGQMHLSPAALPTGAATAPGSPAALDDAAQAAMNKGKDVQSWYKNAIPGKRRGAILTRLGAILLGSVATVIPTVLGIASAGRDPAFLQRWVPIGGVLAVVAALLVLIDKFAGFSTGWMRYIGADQEARSRQEQFQVAWEKERLLWSGPPDAPLPPERATAALDLIAGFINAFNDIVKQETQAWMIEFKGALAELDKATVDARAQASAVQAPSNPRGAIEVVVVGLNKLDQQAWNLQVGSATSSIAYVGATSAAITDLVPGPLKVRVAGTINTKPWSVEKAAVVEAGKTTQLQVNTQG